MIKGKQEITKRKFDKGLNTYKNFFNLGEGQTPDSINVIYNLDGSFGKRLGTSTMNTAVLESTAGYGMYDLGVLGVGGNDSNTNLLLQLNASPVVDSSRRVYAITTYGDFVVSSIQSKFGGASGLFATNPEIDYMEFSSDANAQSAYISSDTTGSTIDVSHTIDADGVQLYGGTGTNEQHAQSFIPTGNIICSKVAIKVSIDGTVSDNTTVRVETNSGGLPSGILVDTNATKTQSVASAGWHTFTFPATFSLSGSTTYWIVISRTGARDTTNFIRLRMAGPGGYSNGTIGTKNSGTWSTGTEDLDFEVHKTSPNLQSYSEATIKQQGAYSLKAIAVMTATLTDTLIRTLSSSSILDLREQNNLSFYLYSSRTGANIRVGLRNSSNLAIMQTTPYVVTTNSWHAINWDISAYVAGSKDGIDRIIFTIMEDSATNTFYVDSITSGAYKVINKNAFISAPDNNDWNIGLGNMTLDNQIYFNFVGTSQVFIGRGSNTTNFWHLKYNTAATNTVNGLYFQIYSAGVLTVNLSGFWSPATNSWYHLELVRNVTNNWYMFVNGSNIFVSGTTAGIVPDFSSLLKLGVNVVTTDNAYLCAFADEWRVSNNARHIAAFTSPTIAYNSDIIQERRLLCAAGTGIYYSSDIGRTFAIVQTNRTANINYFGFIKDYVINTNESYDPPQYWAGTATQYFANISTATPACKHSFSHQGFAILLNESANKTGFYYVDQNSMFSSAWSNFKLPTGRNDELTGGFSIGRTLYVSSKYKIFRLDYIGGNPDWEYVDVKDWGFVPKTVRKVNIQGAGEAVIGLDWTKKIRIFFGSEDEVLSDSIAKNNDITPFYLDNISAVDLNKCWAEDDRKVGVYRLFLAYANSATVSYSINFNYRAGSWYAENNRPYQSGILAADTADNQFMLGCNYNGRVVIMDSGNTEAGTAIAEHYSSPFFYQQSPSRVHKSQQMDMFFSISSSGTIYMEDRGQFSNVWNLRKEMTLSSAISSLQIRHTIDIPESMNVYQFKLSSSANTANPWQCNLIDLSLSDMGIGKE